MSKFKLYISSTFIDMEGVRQALLKKIDNRLSEFFEFTTIMEKMKGDGFNRSDVDVCLDNVRAADVYILLTGKRCGDYPAAYKAKGQTVQNSEKKSYTRLEYEAAREHTKIKRLLIYKFELEDEFFTCENISQHSDLEDTDRKNRYEDFKVLIGQNSSPVSIKTFSQLNDEINDCLAKANLIFSRIVEMDIAPEHKVSIDRISQVKYLKDKYYEFGVQKVISFVVNARSEEDDIDRFSIKAKSILSPGENINTIHWVNTNALSGTLKRKVDLNKTDTLKSEQEIQDEAALMNAILVASSPNIYEAMTRSASFESLRKKIEDYKIKNRYLGFNIETDDDPVLAAYYLRLIYKFLDKLNQCLIDAKFENNFFCFICMQGSPEFFTSNKPTDTIAFENHDLGLLEDVSLTDVNAWINTVISTKDEVFKAEFENNLDNIMTQIFLDTSKFPLSYRKCLQYIETRTKRY